jgi:hypothetical protein
MAETPHLAPIILTQACPYCTKQRWPRDIHKLPGGARICSTCQVSHEAAVLALSGLKANGDGTFSTSAPPPLECSECHRSSRELMAIQGDKRVTLSVIYENGIYRYFCKSCAEVYERKRREFFSGTIYGRMKGL